MRISLRFWQECWSCEPTGGGLALCWNDSLWKEVLLPTPPKMQTNTLMFCSQRNITLMFWSQRRASWTPEQSKGLMSSTWLLVSRDTLAKSHLHWVNERFRTCRSSSKHSEILYDTKPSGWHHLKNDVHSLSDDEYSISKKSSDR